MTEATLTDGQPRLPSTFVNLSVLLLASLTIMANATIAPSLPGMKAHFAHVPGIDTLTGLILTLPSAVIIFTAGIAGWLVDRADRQKLVMLAAFFYAAGGTSGLWAETLPALLIGRGFLGLGVALTMTLALAWGADLWQGPLRAKMMGLQSAFISGGGIVVMLLGGVLATLHWRGAFAVYALVIPVALVALYALAPHSRDLRVRQAEAKASPVETVSEPFPWGAFAFVGPLSFLFIAAFYALPTRMPFYLEELQITNTAIVGAIMATLTVASLPTALLYGRLRQSMSPMMIFAGSFTLMGLGMLVIAGSHSVTGAIIGTMIAGAGLGPSMPNFSTYFMAFVPSSQRGRASGMLTTALFAGQFFSPILSAPLVSAFGLGGMFVAFGGVQLAIAGALVLTAMLQGQRATA